MASEEHSAEDSGFSRRAAFKAVAGATAAAVVWSEPTIRGLARRPAYAEAVSGVPNVFTIELDITLPGPDINGDQQSPIIDSEINNTNPFGYGPLNFVARVQDTPDRPIVRLRSNQNGGNVDAVVTGFSTSMGLTSPVSITTGNDLGVRWAADVAASTGRLFLTITCN